MFKIDVSGVDDLEAAIKQYQGDAEKVINDILHNEAGQLIQESIRRLMPQSGAKWKGKKPPAKTGKSLTQINSNLAVTVTTTSGYQYLYFPNDGTNTRRHVGDKQFFAEGAEKVTNEIVARCIERLSKEI